MATEIPYRYTTPQKYVDQVRTKFGHVYGILGDNAISTTPKALFFQRMICEQELELAICFYNEVIDLIVPEFGEKQRIEAMFMATRPADYKYSFSLIDFPIFEENCVKGDIDLSNERLITLLKHDKSFWIWD